MGAAKTKKQSFVALDVLAALSIVLGLLFMFVPAWNDGADGKVGSPKVHEIVSNSILVILTGLTVVSTTFETIEEYLEHTLPEVFMPVLNALNTELMGMGFLAIIFYFVMKFKLLVALSTATVCKACDPCLGFTAGEPNLTYTSGTGSMLGACVPVGSRRLQRTRARHWPHARRQLLPPRHAGWARPLSWRPPCRRLAPPRCQPGVPPVQCQSEALLAPSPARSNCPRTRRRRR